MKTNSKMCRRIVLILAFIFFLLTGGYAAYANKDTLLNSYYLITKSPSEYYTYIEKYELYRLLSQFPVDTAAKDNTYAYDISSTMTFHHKELDAVLDTVLGTNLTDLENFLNIPLQSISLDMLLASDAYSLNETIGVRLNNTKLFTAEFFLDSIARKLSLRIPELSEAYLTQSLGNNDNKQNTNMKEYRLLNKERMERIVRRYMELYFSHLGTVTLEKKVPLSLDSIQTECNLLTVTFTREEAKKFFLTLSDTAKSDEDILALLPSLPITKEQYLQALEKAEKLVHEKLEETPQEETLQLKLYLDSEGHILSRELTSFGQSNLGYTLLTNKDYREYTIHLSNTFSNYTLLINGTNRKINETNGGKLSLSLHVPSITSSPDLNLDVTYEGLRSVINEEKRYIEGSLTLSSEMLAGIQITSDFHTEMDTQLNTTAIRLGASPIMTISSTGRSLTDYLLTQPEESSTRYDSSRYQEYLDTIDLESYLNTITDSLGIDPELLIDFLSYGPLR